MCISIGYTFSPSIFLGNFKGVNVAFLKQTDFYQAVTFQLIDQYIYIYIYIYVCIIAFFITEFRVSQNHLPHFSEVFQGCYLIFHGHVYNIHHW